MAPVGTARTSTPPSRAPFDATDRAPGHLEEGTRATRFASLQASFVFWPTRHSAKPLVVADRSYLVELRKKKAEPGLSPVRETLSGCLAVPLKKFLCFDPTLRHRPPGGGGLADRAHLPTATRSRSNRSNRQTRSQCFCTSGCPFEPA